MIPSGYSDIGVGLQSWGLGVKFKANPPSSVNQERLKKETGHPRLVGGSFSKATELTYEACLERSQGLCIRPPPQHLQVYLYRGFHQTIWTILSR